MTSVRFTFAVFAVFCVLTGYGEGDKHGCIAFVGKNAVSLGTYPNTDDGTARIQIRNAGEGALQISRVLSTCKCLRIDGYPRSLAPGETGEVSATIVKNEIAGAFSHVFYIESDDPHNRRVMAKVEGNARPLFLIACDTKTLLGPVDAGLVWTGTYTVTATATGLSLGTATVQNRGTRCEYWVRTNAQEQAVYEVTQTVAFEGDGVLESVLFFPVCRPGGAESPPVRLAVTAIRRKALRAVPDRITLAPSQAPVKQRLLLALDVGGPVEAGRLSCKSDVEGMAFTATRAVNPKMLYVDLTFSAEYMGRLASTGADSIRIRYGDRDHIEVPVAVAKK
jgi:hypothetical protein